MQKMRWIAAGLATAGLALAGLTGCGAPDHEAPWDGLPTVASTTSPSSSTGTLQGPDRFTSPTGECGVTLPCGLGAELGATLGSGAHSGG